jgi:hypothetical protein
MRHQTRQRSGQNHQNKDSNFHLLLFFAKVGKANLKYQNAVKIFNGRFKFSKNC